ncbi:MAG TPA: glycerol-3-phosphate 1-O-acyltransferase PlsY [Opitutaceae bacterium]|nr:glycerol-3-phosphate 1-O-acyltransferase PlsY [Opitutaceae bacterium]
MTAVFVIAAVAGYFLGALPFGWLVARAHGVDIFKEGSGNPGATNVKRVLGEKFGARGKRAGNLVFALDALKGALAAGWPRVLRFHEHLVGADGRMLRHFDTAEVWHELALVGLIAAVLGHSFSVFTGFKGGKGVATAAGGVLVMTPTACLIGAAVWVVTFYTTRYVSLGSILASVVVPAAGWILGNPLPVNIVVTLLGAFVIFRHRENIRRLLAGTESRFVRKS